MKKIITIAAALGLMASMGTAAFADSASTTSTTNSTPSTTTSATGSSETVAEPTKLVPEPIISAGEEVTNPTVPLILTVNTPFYFEPGGKVASVLAPQVVDTTGNRVGSLLGEWVEVYTWLGTAWILVK
ncbi:MULTISPECIES: hypothetical protein [Paenibacillus]|uniref:hypothetical protein n=1 Tax=Paenibacillus TaxID=44249 RepID=UPI0013D70EB4|nr:MULTISPECIES: hypothetical protein [Paenibacillus]UYO05003.1 hypothetical protein K2F33_03165 [Paenibacillus sp. PSB04]GIO64914.1 hypothetical protein J43TS9_64880 [Paenibacillus cineris]